MREISENFGENNPDIAREERIYSTPEHGFYSVGGKVLFRTRFGNTGLYWIVNPQFKGLAWQMHFAPEDMISRPPKTHTSAVREYGKYKYRADNDEEYLNDVKYARMFAEGVRSMVDFYSHIAEIKNPDHKKLFLKNPPKKLRFGTNRRMEDFATKLIGEKYCKDDTIFLEKLAAEAAKNPEVLKKVRQFADPEKLKEFTVKNSDFQ